MGTPRHPGCDNKCRFTSWGQAKSVATRHHHGDDADQFRVYGCAHCGGYHFTTMDKRTFNRLRSAYPKYRAFRCVEEALGQN